MKRLLMVLAAVLLAGALVWRNGQRALPVQAPAETAEHAEPAAMTVQGREVPLWAYRYWLGRACRQAESDCKAAGQAPDWTASGPESLREQVRARAVADAALCAVVEDRARTQGCGLTEEDSRTLDALWQQRVQAHGGEEAYIQHLSSQGLTPEQARALAETGQRYRRLHAQAADPESPYAPTPEQLADFAEKGNYLAVNRIYVSGPDAQKRISALFRQLNEAPDPQALFSGLAAGGEDHLGRRTFQLGDGTLSPALEQAAESLEPGVHSGILQDGSGYAILLRLTPSLPYLTARWLDAELEAAAAVSAPRTLPAMETVSIPLFS